MNGTPITTGRASYVAALIDRLQRWPVGTDATGLCDRIERNIDRLEGAPATAEQPGPTLTIAAAFDRAFEAMGREAAIDRIESDMADPEPDSKDLQGPAELPEPLIAPATTAEVIEREEPPSEAPPLTVERLAELGHAPALAVVTHPTGDGLTARQQEYIDAVRAANGNQGQAAKALGMVNSGGVSSLMGQLRRQGRLPDDIAQMLAMRAASTAMETCEPGCGGSFRQEGFAAHQRSCEPFQAYRAAHVVDAGGRHEPAPLPDGLDVGAERDAFAARRTENARRAADAAWSKRHGGEAIR